MAGKRFTTLATYETYAEYMTKHAARRKALAKTRRKGREAMAGGSVPKMPMGVSTGSTIPGQMPSLAIKLPKRPKSLARKQYGKLKRDRKRLMKGL